MADGVKVEVKGAAELSRSLSAASRDLMDMTPANQDAGQIVARNAAARAPRRTGRLAGSLRPLRVTGTDVQVGSSVSYAIFQEFGTRHVRPRYYLRGALSELTLEPYQSYTDDILGRVRGM